MANQGSEPVIYLVGIVAGMLVFVGPEVLAQLDEETLDIISLALSTVFGVIFGIMASKLFIVMLRKVHGDQ